MLIKPSVSQKNVRSGFLSPLKSIVGKESGLKSRQAPSNEVPV